MLFGVILSIITIFILNFISLKKRNELLSYLLISIAFIYIGFAISDGRILEIIIQMIITSIFLGIVLLANWKSTYFLGIGFVLHGIWDLFHWDMSHGLITNIDVAEWYTSFCLFYDLIIGIYIIYYTIRNKNGVWTKGI